MDVAEKQLQELVMTMVGTAVALSYIWIATLLPPKLRVHLSRRRLRWIERCRGLHSQALQHIREGKREFAEEALQELGQWQSRWEARQTLGARWQRAFWVVLTVWIACVVVKLSPFLALIYVGLETPSSIFGNFEFMAVYTGFALLIVLCQYFALGRDEDVLAGEDFVGRLRRALDADQERREGRHFPDLHDIPALRLLFGLGDRFTARDLDKARRRLAAELHPDRGQDVPERVRRAREEMLKHVNAAYERLRPFAS